MHIREGGSGAEVQFQNPKPDGGRQSIAPQLISAKNIDILCHNNRHILFHLESEIVKIWFVPCISSSPRAKPGDFPSLYCGS